MQHSFRHYVFGVGAVLVAVGGFSILNALWWPIPIVSPVTMAAMPFATGTRVVTNTRTAVYSEPFPTSTIVGFQATSTLGTILGGPLFVGEYTWWRVEYQNDPATTSTIGWSRNYALAFPYFPAANTSWRSLVTRNVAPSVNGKQDIKNKTGINWDKLKLAADYSNKYATNNTSGVLVIKNGWIVGEWGSIDARNVASISKSLTGMAIAKLMNMSTTTLSDKAHLHLPSEWITSQPANNKPSKKNITLEDLMTMTSGLIPNDKPTAPQYAGQVLTTAVKVAPGLEWTYSSLPVDLLSLVIENDTKKTLEKFFNEQIGSKIGISTIKWGTFGTTSPPHSRGSSGANVTPRDLSRIGYLMLMDGKWDMGAAQKSVISRDNVRMLYSLPSATTTAKFVATPESPFVVASDAPTHYGHLWWTNKTGTALGASVPRDAYYGHGYPDRLLVVIPSENMVVIRVGTAASNVPEFRTEFMKRVMDAVVVRQKPIVSPPPPAPTTTNSTTTPRVVSFTLMNADTDTPIPAFDPIPEGAMIASTTTGGVGLNVRINVGGTVGSVMVMPDNTIWHTETIPPYSLSDSGTNYDVWPFTPGPHTVSAIAFSGSNASGTKSATTTINFTLY